MEHEITEILDFWLAAGPKKWWKKDDHFDAEIKRRFGGVHEAASRGELDHWAKEPDSALALIIVMDQFSRNLFRDDGRAFALDARCREIVGDVMEVGLDRKMRSEIAVFCYMPLMHSEQLEDQKTGLVEMSRLGLEDNVKYARIHLEIIERFGRFPHRNKVLGRVTSKDEQAFLDGGGFSG